MKVTSWLDLLRVSPALHPPERPSHTHTPEPGFGGRGHEYVVQCVVFFSHSFWTLSSLDVPAGVIQEKGHTGFLIHLLSAVRALIFLARRIQPFLSLVDREVEFSVLTIQSFFTRCHDNVNMVLIV